MDIIKAIIGLLTGLGSLLLGFKLLSDNIEKLANGKIRNLINKTGKNRFVGVGIGAIVTAIVQSSGATTVMIVGFVNAGLMSLFTATSLIMGANIGTTITAQIVALNSFDISLFLMLCLPIGIIITMCFKKDSVKNSGMALVGLGLIFLALKYMSDSMSVFKESDAFTNILKSVDNPFLLLGIGIIFTVLLQSSSATTSILITMVAGGLTIGSGGNDILYVVLGTNIGSCATALISSLGANLNAKRVAIIHLLFNVFGSILFFIVLLCWPGFMEDTLQKMFKNAPGTQIAMFHTFFNVFCTILFLPFVNVFVKLSQLIIRDKKKEEIKYSVLEDRFLSTPALAIDSAKKEILKSGKLSIKVLSNSIDAFLEKDLDKANKVNEETEDIDKLNKEIISYMVKISSTSLNQAEEKYVSNLHYMITDFYRLVEIADNMRKYTVHLVNDKLEFSDNVFNDIKKFKDMLNEQYNNVFEYVNNQDDETLKKISSLENNIDSLRSKMINDHILRLEEGKCKPNNSGVYINLVSNLERAGDHLNNIAELAK